MGFRQRMTGLIQAVNGLLGHSVRQASSPPSLARQYYDHCVQLMVYGIVLFWLLMIVTAPIVVAWAFFGGIGFLAGWWLAAVWGMAVSWCAVFGLLAIHAVLIRLVDHQPWPRALLVLSFGGLGAVGACVWWATRDRSQPLLWYEQVLMLGFGLWVVVLFVMGMIRTDRQLQQAAAWKRMGYWVTSGLWLYFLIGYMVTQVLPVFETQALHAWQEGMRQGQLMSVLLMLVMQVVIRSERR